MIRACRLQVVVPACKVNELDGSPVGRKGVGCAIIRRCHATWESFDHVVREYGASEITVQSMPDCLSRAPMTVLHPASIT